jgi:hypothetical protein
MATELERLSVLIEANTKSYERAMVRMQRQTEKAIRGASKSVKGLNAQLASASKVAKGFAGAFGVGIGVGAFKQFASAIAQTVGQADDMQDLADKIGITAEKLQELQYQAKVTGSSAEDMAAALDQFTKRIGEAAQGGGPLKKVLEQQNIALRDQAGNLRPITDLLNDYADAIKNAGSDAERLALAQDAFRNTDMASVFRNGAAGIREMGNEAHRTSQIISNETTKALADIKPELDRLEGAWSVAWANIALMTLSALEKIGQAEHAILDPVIKAVNDLRSGQAGRDIAAAHLQHLRSLQKSGQLPGVVLPFPGKEKDDLALPSSSSKSRALFPGKAADDLIIKIVPAVKALTEATEEATDARIQSAGAIADETESLSAQLPVIGQQNAAQDQLIERLDAIRDASGSALDAFAQSIANSEGPLAALKASLVDLLQTIIRIGEQQAIMQLFGAAGTSGGGILGPIVSAVTGRVAPAMATATRAGGAQLVNVNVTASPLLHATVNNGARQAEERAISRGPAVARNNSRRYATP